MKKIAALSVIVCFASACANNPEGQSAIEGGGIGAGVGIVGCAIAKCKGEQYAAAAAIGAGVGAAIGYSLAKDINKRKQELAGKENDLDARIRYVRGLNADTAKFNGDLKKQVAGLQQQIDQGSLSGQQLVKRRQQLDQQIADANTQLKAADAELADMKRFRAQKSTPNSAALDSEIARLEGVLAEAHTNTTALASMRQRI